MHHSRGTARVRTPDARPCTYRDMKAHTVCHTRCLVCQAHSYGVSQEVGSVPGTGWLSPILLS